jgi:hypothetical protein
MAENNSSIPNSYCFINKNVLNRFTQFSTLLSNCVKLITGKMQLVLVA